MTTGNLEFFHSFTLLDENIIWLVTPNFLVVLWLWKNLFMVLFLIWIVLRFRRVVNKKPFSEFVLESAHTLFFLINYFTAPSLSVAYEMSWPGIKPRPTALGHGVSHWATKEVSYMLCFYLCIKESSLMRSMRCVTSFCYTWKRSKLVKPVENYRQKRWRHRDICSLSRFSWSSSRASVLPSVLWAALCRPLQEIEAQCPCPVAVMVDLQCVCSLMCFQVLRYNIFITSSLPIYLFSHCCHRDLENTVNFID